MTVAAPDWDALIARHDRRVLLMLLARGIRIDKARDITQETWARLIAHQRAGRILRIELPGLALKQALFLALDDARRTRREWLGSDEEMQAILDPAPSVEDAIVARERLAIASAELDRCSPKARAVFESIYDEEGASHAETAEKIGLSVQRVRQTICEVRAKLRAALTDDPSPVDVARATTTTDRKTHD